MLNIGLLILYFLQLQLFVCGQIVITIGLIVADKSLLSHY